ncbi:glutamyl endopeptidase [Microdochium nivale]|nr:glutamyl endopeptidase [Microdochium nivale]
MPGVVLTNGTSVKKAMEFGKRGPNGTVAAAMSSFDSQAAAVVDATKATTTTRVRAWALEPSTSSVQPPTETEALLSTQPGIESVIGGDDRTLVPKADFAPGGKYRWVVKLFLRFEGQEDDDPWAVATGWLVRPDLVITAGHCIFDNAHGYNRVVQVKAYVGYSGKDSVTDTSYAVQFREASHVATTDGWIRSEGFDSSTDLGLIRLAQPFAEVKPMGLSAAPLRGKGVLGIVGYPADLEEGGEKGAEMWEMFLETEWDLSKTKDHVLQYQIDTYGGNSGSAVLWKPTGSTEWTSIGVHVYGGRLNSASVIGPLGNRIETYMTAIDAFASGSRNTPGVTIETSPHSRMTEILVSGVPPPPDWDVVPGPGGPNPPKEPGDEVELGGDGPGTLGGKISGVDEGFLDILNKAVRMVSPIATSILGLESGGLTVGKQIGVPLGCLSAVALHAAGKLAQSTRTAELDSGKRYALNGAVERSILHEAALEGLKHLGNQKCKDLGIFRSMAMRVRYQAPTVTAVAPLVMSAVSEAALRLSLESLSKAQAGSEATWVQKPIRAARKGEHNTMGFGSRLADNREAFVEVLTANLTSKDTEGFLDVLSSVGSVIGKGLRIAGPVLSSVSQVGLPMLLRGLEADINDSGRPGPSHFDGFAQRALIGEAALEALLECDVHELQRQEGLFDVFKKVITKVGPVVLKMAPSVIGAVRPVVRAALAQGGASPGAGGSAETAWVGPGDGGAGDYATFNNADVAITWLPLAGYQEFHGWVHLLENPIGHQVLSSQITAGVALTAADLARKTLGFAMEQYGRIVCTVAGGPGFVAELHRYLKIFGPLTPEGATVRPLTVANVVAVLNPPQLAAVPADTQAQLAKIEAHINSRQTWPELPADIQNTWFWLFVLSCIEMGTISLQGNTVTLLADRQVLYDYIQRPPGAPPLRLDLHAASFIRLLQHMMVNFTYNVWTPKANMPRHTLADW